MDTTTLETEIQDGISATYISTDTFGETHDFLGGSGLGDGAVALDDDEWVVMEEGGGWDFFEPDDNTGYLPPETIFATAQETVMTSAFMSVVATVVTAVGQHMLTCNGADGHGGGSYNTALSLPPSLLPMHQSHTGSIFDQFHFHSGTELVAHDHGHNHDDDETHFHFHYEDDDDEP